MQFGLSPATIAALPPNDPLFVAEYNLNPITLTVRSLPSDLRGPITATNGLTGTVVYGTNAAYQVYGGSAALVLTPSRRSRPTWWSCPATRRTRQP